MWARSSASSLGSAWMIQRCGCRVFLPSGDASLVQPLADGAGGHAEFSREQRQPPFVFSRCVVGVGGQGLAPVGDRRSGAVQDLGDEAVADRSGTAGREEPFGVELAGDALGIPASAGQFGDPLGQLRVVTEVFGPLDRPADHLVGLLSAGPAHGDVDESLRPRIAIVIWSMTARMTSLRSASVVLGAAHRPGRSAAAAVIAAFCWVVSAGGAFWQKRCQSSVSCCWAVRAAVPVLFQRPGHQAVFRFGQPGNSAGPGRRRSGRVPGAAARFSRCRPGRRGSARRPAG